MATISFNELPQDIILHVFEKLDYKDVCHLTGVNRHFKELGTDNNLWYKLYVKRWGEPKAPLQSLPGVGVDTTPATD